MKGFAEISEPALVWTGKVMLEGRIAIPPDPQAVVIFASVPSLNDDARDAGIIEALREAHVATVYVPLLSDDEQQFDARTSHFRHDTDFLAQRFLEVAQWVRQNRTTASLPIGLIGSSGGAAGALSAAAQKPELVATVVSIDGRTDLAVDSIKHLGVPTLLVVKDMPVLRMNREALSKIRGERRIEIVHGADAHAVEAVVQKTAQWLEEKLAAVAAA